MKIRTDFVTNSSSSSYVTVKIKNPVLQEILERYGYDDLMSIQGEYDNGEDWTDFFPKRTDEVVSFLIDELTDFHWCTDDDRNGEECARELRSHAWEIEWNYREIEMSIYTDYEYGEGGHGKKLDPDTVRARIVDACAFANSGRPREEYIKQLLKQIKNENIRKCIKEAAAKAYPEQPLTLQGKTVAINTTYWNRLPNLKYFLKEAIQSCGATVITHDEEADFVVLLLDQKNTGKKQVPIHERPIYMFLPDLMKVLLDNDFATNTPGFDAKTLSSLVISMPDFMIQVSFTQMIDDYTHNEFFHGTAQDFKQVVKKTRIASLNKEKLAILEKLQSIYEKLYVLTRNHPISFQGKTFCIIESNVAISEKKLKYLGADYTENINDEADYIVYDVPHDPWMSLSENEFTDNEKNLKSTCDEMSQYLDSYEKNPKGTLIAGQDLKDVLEAEFLSRIDPEMYQPIINHDAAITFEGKHFSFIDCNEDDRSILDSIERKGGIIHSYGRKSSDYLIIGNSHGVEYSEDTAKTLRWISQGAFIQLITPDMVRAALKRKPHELAALAKKAEEKRQLLLEEQRQRELQKLREEQERLAIEREKARAEREALRQQRAAEEAERKRAAAEARRQEMERQRALIIEQQERQAEEKRLQRQALLDSAVIAYAPGEEPPKIHARLSMLFAKLDRAYPDKIISGFATSHSSWAETVTQLRYLLGYPDNAAFLEAYGYTVSSDKGGRPTTTNGENDSTEIHMPLQTVAQPDELTESDKKYLAAIIQLSKEHSDVKAVDFANYLSVSKPSVSVALKRLSDKGYIYLDLNKSIHSLTNIVETDSSNQGGDMEIESDLGAQLSDSEKKYVWAIQQLQKELDLVRAVDVANKLNVSKPSASIALKKLRERGIVLLQPNGSLSIAASDAEALPSEQEST